MLSGCVCTEHVALRTETTTLQQPAALPNLSSHYAMTLGFTTSEYQTALRYQILEGREIYSEEELAELTSPQRTQKWNFKYASEPGR